MKAYKFYRFTTDGEGIERGWSSFGLMGTSTRQMGPGGRSDTLDDHFGDANWQKLIGLGMLDIDSVLAFSLTCLQDQCSQNGLPRQQNRASAMHMPYAFSQGYKATIRLSGVS